MQSRFLLTAVLVSAASFVAEAQNSTQDALTTAATISDSQVSRILNSLDSYQATIATESGYIAISKYIASASDDFASAIASENDAFFSLLPTTGSVALPPHITGFPSSLRSYASKLLEDEASIIDALVITPSGGGSTTKTGGSSSPTDTQTGSTSTNSGAESSNTSSASGSSSAAASSNSAASASRSSPSSSTGNAAAQPTGALKAAGAIAAGVMGLIAVA